MYDYFELGLSERLSARPHQLSDRTKALLKQAFFGSSPAYTGGQDDGDSGGGGGMPWGTMAMMGLLGAGGAWAHGQYAQNSPFANFSQSINNNVVNPIRGRFNSLMTSPEAEATRIRQNADQGGMQSATDGITSNSQLHGTPYHSPDGLEQTAEVGSHVGHAGMLGGIGAAAGKFGLKKWAPAQATRLAGTAVGKGMNTAGKALLGHAAAPLHALTTIPDGLQLGEKASDAMGIQNGLGRGLMKGTGVAAGAGATMAGEHLGHMAGAALGARFGKNFGGVGTFVGGALGALAPNVVNGMFNRANNNKLLMNQAAGRANSFKTDFTNAMQQKQWGNDKPLAGWYGAQQTPQYLKQTMDQFKDNPDLQNQIRLNAPPAMLGHQ